MKNLINEIKYHKVVSEAKALLLFDEVFEEYVNTINMPDGNQWYKNADNTIELRKSPIEIEEENTEI